MLQIFIYLLAGTAGLFLGLLVGWVLIDLRLQHELKVILASILRVTRKKWLRSIDPNFDIARVQRDHSFIDLSMDARVGLVDRRAIDAATELKQRLSPRFKDQIEALYLFGSRVRGDYRPDSDVDVAIFLNDLHSSDLLGKELLSHSSELLLEYGLFIQPRIFGPSSGDDTEDPENYLAGIAVSYGIPV